MAREWYEEGLIYKDAQTSQDYGVNMIKNEVAAGIVHAVEMGNQALVESQTGFPDTQIDVAACKVNTASFTKFGMGVPVSTVDQDRAVALLNLIWDNEEYRNTLSWGVEGVDWQRTDHNTAEYPEGMSEENAYHTSDFLYGNRLETIPWEAEGADTLRERQKAANAALEVSKYFGFAVDQENVTETVAAVKNVRDAYYAQLCSGTVADVDATLDEFIQKLYDAGMQDLIDTYQAQLDDWLAMNGK
jgi:putative aldouronate transport system substrate-binding protein